MKKDFGEIRGFGADKDKVLCPFCRMFHRPGDPCLPNPYMPKLPIIRFAPEEKEDVEKVTVPQKIIGEVPENIKNLSGIIRKLSFGTYNMSQDQPDRIVTQSAVTKDGRVIVSRVGGIEVVRIFPSRVGDLGDVWIELISAGYSYRGLYTITNQAISRAIPLTRFTHDYSVWNGYFDPPPYDPGIESCNYVTPPWALVSADPLMLDAVSHYDDWHYNKFKWTGYPYWKAAGSIYPGDNTGLHPSFNYGSRETYSCSQYTYKDQRTHIRRSINQEVRLFRPGRLVTGGHDYGVLPQKIIGKRPFSSYTGDPTYWKQAIVWGGVVHATINTPNTGPANAFMFFWPFLPYMWEMTGFWFLYFNRNEALYGSCIAPDEGTFNIWNLQYTDPIGSVGSLELHRDSASYSITDRENASVPTGGGWDPELPNMYLGEPASGTHHRESSYHQEYSVNIKRFSPIGTVGNMKDLYLETTCIGSGGMSMLGVEHQVKSTNFPPPYNFMTPEMQPGWWPFGSYTETNYHYYNRTDRWYKTFNLTQYLKFGDTVVDTGVGTLSYDFTLQDNQTYDETTTCVISKTGPGLPYVPNTETWNINAVGDGTKQGSGPAVRDVVCFEVLDYDSDPNYSRGHLVAMIYKRITIHHELPMVIDNWYHETGMTWHPDWNLPTALVRSRNLPWDYSSDKNSGYVDEHCYAKGTRKVEYILYINVGGSILTKALETIDVVLDMSAGGNESLSVTGNRAYGVTVKFTNDNLVLYTYSQEGFVGPQGVHGAMMGYSYYDSPCNFEDYTYGVQNARVWNPLKQVVGIVQVSKEAWGKSAKDLQDPISEEIYALNSRLKG